MTALLIGIIALAIGICTGIVLAHFFGSPEQSQPVSDESVSPLLARARVLTAQVDALDASGEYKRHQVYARLIKDFPGQTKREVSRAIEAALDLQTKGRP